MERLIEVKDVARLLGVSAAFVYRAVQRKGLPYVKLGTGRSAPLRFRESEIEAWLASTSFPEAGHE